MLRQIILISDGQSNKGPNPGEVSELALKEDIRVNTIGIIDNNKNQMAIMELEDIAERGGGVCELTHLNHLSETLSRVTINSIYTTIEEMVSHELKEIIDMDIKDIHPVEREKFVKLIDMIGNEADLKCLILLDASGSMKNKIDIAKKSVLELLLFLEERKGKNEVGVLIFPGKEEYYDLLCDFTEDIDELKNSLDNINIGGITPTGYAIEGAIDIFVNARYDDIPYNHIV
ncbi:Ca-activated chloride channel family protein [Keratinibaculum paraultunense]|uniref:Ca-activated chloride channel family protein n=1 Tax=Keratinibaculum paraultunense TaxID=1278232 RepID=A0A4R3KTJ4_9FIRM|nr:VWA domain-containing protein [Keratinibaculum paraultunense]QQY79484.1 VWA domain-containing protein [Keratinibaculum paraultunense]TCS88021.1 Ca-activated chloride channel family protein [Keratinibaculum paraultunense]